MNFTPAWERTLGKLVNSVAISANGKIAVAGTYYYPYPGTTSNVTEGRYGAYAFDAAGAELWKDEYDGNEGVYAVAVSGDGGVAASGGLLSGGRHSEPGTPNRGLLRAFQANGARLLDFNQITTRVNYIALSHDGAVLAAVTLGGDLLVFRRQAGGQFQAVAQHPVTGGPRLDMVAVHPSGAWLIACGRKGKLHLVELDASGVKRTHTWTAPGKPRFLACALASTSDEFLAGGENKVYLFSKTSMTRPAGPRYLDQFDTPDGGTSDDLRWLAISPDGKFVSLVQNLGNDAAGIILGLKNDDGQLTETWRKTLNHNPNSTSIDAAGKLVTAADGHPVGTPGTYYLFRVSDGQKLGEFATSDMNWPLVLSADGGSAAGGSDNGKMYYFKL